MIICPTLHPAALLRGRDDTAGNARFLSTVIGDFKKAKIFLKRRPQWDESVIWKQDAEGRYVNLFPTLAEVDNFLRNAWQKKLTLFVDVETTGEEPLYCQLICVGIADSAGNAICVPILKQGGERYWSPEQSRQIYELLSFVLGDPTVAKCFHNGPFDTVVLYGNGIVVRGYSEDTMAAHHVADGELPHGLAFCASVHLEIPYWKDDVKGDKKWLELDDHTLRLYNLRDCLSTARILPPLKTEIKKHGLEGLYHDEVTISRIMTRATIRGLEIDLERRDSEELDKDGKPKGLGPRLRLQRNNAFEVLQEVAGSTGFKPRSPVHLRYLLFERLKFPIVKRTDKGAPSTDKDAMVLLALNADRPEQQKALRALIEYRQADKMLGTWVEGLPVLGDGRVHPSWKLLTTTGRFSSSPNAQNFNRAIKKIFKSGKGQKFVSVDLSQAELRVMAYFSGDSDLLRMYEEGVNVHTANASLLFQIKCPNPKDTNAQTENYLREMCPRLIGMDYDGLAPDGSPLFTPAPKDRWKGIRTLAKNFVFGDNYGAEAETLYQVIRSKRDPDTNDLLFPDVTLGEIETLKIMWERLHPAIPKWWATITEATQKQGFYRCPISGRIRWFRGGFRRTEMLNSPIQSGVASFMNKQMIKIDHDLEVQTGRAAEIVLQVHDALTVESPDEYVPIVKDILMARLNEPFSLPGFPVAKLPADEATVGEFLDEV